MFEEHERRDGGGAGAVVVATRGERVASLETLSPAVLCEVASAHKIGEHEGQRGGVRCPGSQCAGAEADALGFGLVLMS